MLGPKPTSLCSNIPSCVTLGISLNLSELPSPVHKSQFSKAIVKIKEVAIARGWGWGVADTIEALYRSLLLLFF